jgi:signal transduction histidine kinase
MVTSADPPGMVTSASSPRGGLRIALGTGLLVASGLLVARAAGPWPGDAIVWPLCAAAVGGLLIWRQPRPAAPRRRASWAAHRREEPAPVVVAPPLLRAIAQPQLSRSGLGAAVILAAALAFLWANGALQPAGQVVLAALVALVALALIFAPSWRRLVRTLSAERAERVRSQERADVAAHLHDSVLQTLALIQRSADDPRAVAALARRQERELRAWLAAGDEPSAGDRLVGALEAAAADVEAATGGAVEVVAVGDWPLDERASAVVAAAREAMLNAAKFGGDGPVAVYAEAGDDAIHVFVRDRGPGFDPAAIPPERRGVRESIVGRMERAGGRAAIRRSQGGGTEVEIAIEGGRG